MLMKLPVIDVGVHHGISVKPGSKPSYQRPRRLSKKEEVEVCSEIDELTKQGLIEQSFSLWAAPIACARRKNGKLRLAIDYVNLNAQSYVHSQHPLPVIEDLLDHLGKATYFSTMEVKSGYHQMPVKESEKELTSFFVPGQFEWKHGCPFGLSGSPYSFRCMMTAVTATNNLYKLIY